MGDHQKRADGWEMLFNTYRVAIELIRRDEKSLLYHTGQ